MSHERFYSRVNGPTIQVTEYLLATSWSNHSVPGYPQVLLESPDQ
ncbi:hypothetical protein QFZ66_001912 [Streptomyces sp. B4I13]|nr:MULTISPECIES: hypothetical protein [Streptomyces]MDQ0834379.1 hypothetical protein [Streptomyces achromogenes]MDQ0958034.1 hypothetical protein [Streptomyces sp. B4I13]